MKKLLMILIVFVSLLNGFEISYRIQGLGSTFAYLIPDHETDLYRNPEWLSKKTIGVSYTRPYYSVGHKPLALVLLLKGFGWYGRYWPSYSSSLETSQGSNDWIKQNVLDIYFSDLWMVRIKGDVWNIYNDGSMRFYELTDSYDHKTYDRTIEYFLKSAGGFSLGKKLYLSIIAALGIYNKYSESGMLTELDQLLLISSGRLGLFYRNEAAGNKFTSWYIEVGGPLTTGEIDALPYSVYRELYESDRRSRILGGAFLAKLGWAKSLPIDENSFVALGFKEDFSYQWTQQADTILYLHGIRNTFALPLAVEYYIKNVALRFGVYLKYTFADNREFNDDYTLKENLSHNLAYSYSFGLGWEPRKNLVIDLQNTGNLTILTSWSIYFKYLF